MAALTAVHSICGGTITTKNIAGGNTGDTLQLTGARPGVMQRISDIAIHAAGTVTAFSLIIHKADGSTIQNQFGGQVGGAATGPLGPYVFNFVNPVNLTANDNAILTLTITGATAGTVFATVNYTLGSA